MLTHIDTGTQTIIQMHKAPTLPPQSATAGILGSWAGPELRGEGGGWPGLDGSCLGETEREADIVAGGPGLGHWSFWPVSICSRQGSSWVSSRLCAEFWSKKEVHGAGGRAWR